MNLTRVGEGKVVLIAGGGKTYTDIAARFCRSEAELDTIVASPQSKTLLNHIINSNHSAVLEFDDFIFGITGYARVTEAQLIRKRHASYMIKSGRNELNGKRAFDVVLPESIKHIPCHIELNPDKVFIKDNNDMTPVSNYIDMTNKSLYWSYNEMDILNLIEVFYSTGLDMGIAEEDLRYMKPQGTMFKACIKMNASGLRDWFQIRMCNRAQTEIRDLATKIYKLCNEAAPELFVGAGPSCCVLGYCPEEEQCKEFVNKIPTKAEALEIIRKNY